METRIQAAVLGIPLTAVAMKPYSIVQLVFQGFEGVCLGCRLLEQSGTSRDELTFNSVGDAVVKVTPGAAGSTFRLRMTSCEFLLASG